MTQGPAEAYEMARRQLPLPDERVFRGRGKGGRRPTGGRRVYNTTRMEDYRAKQSLITEAQLSEELKKKLFPGVKNEQTASERLEAVNTMKAITLCVTTRAIGFGTVNVFIAMFEFNNVPVRGNIYQLYRVALAAFECKVKIVNRGITSIESNVDDYQESRQNEDFVVAAKGIVAMPDQLSSVINAIGKVKHFDSVYVPKIGRNQLTVGGQFIPQSEQVTYSNLRRVIEALSNPETPQVTRTRFYRNNPIPGAIWNGAPNNPILVNGDEIMPEGYTTENLMDDIEDIHSKIIFMNRKGPKYFTQPIGYEIDGTKSMLVCNKQESLRACDRNPGEELEEYYRRIRVEGNVEEYFNLVHLTTGEQMNGNLTLLGEQPQIGQLMYPIYIMRDERVCTEYSNLSYKAARNIKYT